MRPLLSCLLLACTALACAEDGLPAPPDGVNKERVATFQAAVKSGDEPGIVAVLKQIKADKAAIPKGTPKADKDKTNATLDAEAKYLQEWKKAYAAAKGKADQKAAEDKEAANRKAIDDAQKKAEQDKADAVKKAEADKQQEQAAGGFSDTDLNVTVAEFRKKLGVFAAETDIEQGLAKLGELTVSLIAIQRTVCTMGTGSEKDFAAYDKLRGEYTTAIAAQSGAGGVKGKRYAGASKDLLEELAAKEAWAKEQVVIRIVRVNINAYGKYLRDIKELPGSEKDLTEGYAETRWVLPFKHDAVPEGQKEFILLKVKGNHAPAIISNPQLNGGKIHVGSLATLKADPGMHLDYNIRMLEGPAALAIWEQAVKIAVSGGDSEEQVFPKVLSTTLAQGGFVQ
jgi:hypothetical protein